MRILGIDPGYDRLGIAIIERDGRSETLLFSDCILTKNTDAHHKRLLAVGQSLQKVIREFKPDLLVVEKTFFGKNKKTALTVSEARGVILYEASLAGLSVEEFSPAEIKIAITGYGASTKKQIADMLKRLIQIKKKILYDDEFDAIAVALTGSAHTRI